MDSALLGGALYGPEKHDVTGQDDVMGRVARHHPVL
jgi:hypothetical protein